LFIRAHSFWSKTLALLLSGLADWLGICAAGFMLWASPQTPVVATCEQEQEQEQEQE
jgi:hypothetical protein